MFIVADLAKTANELFSTFCLRKWDGTHYATLLSRLVMYHVIGFTGHTGNE